MPDLLQIVLSVLICVRYLEIDGLLNLRTDAGKLGCSFASFWNGLTTQKVAHLLMH